VTITKNRTVRNTRETIFPSTFEKLNQNFANGRNSLGAVIVTINSTVPIGKKYSGEMTKARTRFIRVRARPESLHCEVESFLRRNGIGW
jgi:hypothetical protein